MGEQGPAPNQAVRLSTSSPEWMYTLKINVLQKSIFSSGRLKGLGIIVGIAIAAMAVFALTHAIKHIDYDDVLDVIERTPGHLIALATLLVAVSYGSLTLYDLLALRTIGRTDVPYRTAALASFTSYPISHGIGAVALVSPVIRYRIYSARGLGALDVANICFLTGLTFWLGNLTALGFSLFYEPGAIGLVDYLPPKVNRALAALVLCGVAGFLVWSWRAP